MNFLYPLLDYKPCIYVKSEHYVNVQQTFINQLSKCYKGYITHTTKMEIITLTENFWVCLKIFLVYVFETEKSIAPHFLLSLSVHKKITSTMKITLENNKKNPTAFYTTSTFSHSCLCSCFHRYEWKQKQNAIPMPSHSNLAASSL